MGNCVSDPAQKYVEADDEKIMICDSSSETQVLMEQKINAKYVSNEDDINSRSTSHTDGRNGCSRRRSNQQFMLGSGSSEDERIILMHNLNFSHCERKPCKPAKSNFRRNIAAASQEQRASGRSVHRLKVVISAKELRELLINSAESAAHNSREAALATFVLEKLSERRVVMMNSANKPAKSVQVKGNYNNNNRSWRPSLEDIPELFTEE